MISKIPSREITLFSRQIATLLTAGIPLAYSLKIVESNIHVSLKSVVRALAIDINEGNSFHRALKKYPHLFDPLYCTLVAVGELSGRLDDLLNHLASYKEKNELLLRKIKMAMIYPSIVLFLAFSAIFILFTHVIPTMKLIFKEFNGELPTFTKIVLGISDHIQQHGILMLIISAIFVQCCVLFYRRTISLQHYFHRGLLRCPIVGSIIKFNILSRFCWSLTTALSAGVPLIEALAALSTITLNHVYRSALHQLKLDVTQGNSLYVAMQNTAFFPAFMLQMIHIGEESGKLEYLLKKTALLYEEAFDFKLSSTVSLLEPLMTILLGIIMSAFVISVYLPIMKMGSLF